MNRAHWRKLEALAKVAVAEQKRLKRRALKAKTSAPVKPAPVVPIVEAKRKGLDPVGLRNAAAMARAFTKSMRRPSLELPLTKRPFDIGKHHPPQVVRDAKMAMDSDSGLTEAALWANASISSNFLEGTTFLGYAYLSELAQRPEYRMICETTATEMTREWIDFSSKSGKEKEKTKKINELKDEFQRLNVQGVFARALQQDGYFGRAHIYVDTGQENDGAELGKSIGDGWDKMTMAKFGKDAKGKSALKINALRTIEAVWCYPTDYNSNNPLKNDWYRPKQWYAQANIVHATRLITLVGREVPDLLKPTYSFGGMSLSQLAKPYVDNWLQTRQSVNDIINAFSVMVLSTNLGESLQADGEALFERANLFNTLRSNAGLMIVDKESEEFQNVAAPIGGLHELQSQAQEHMCSVAHTPTVKLLGLQPAGLNADSEGVMASYYDWVLACQEHQIRPHLHQIMGLIMTALWGEPDEDIVFTFKRLKQPTDKERADLRKADADRDVAYVEASILSAEEVRQRLADDTDSGYDSIQVSKLPEPPEAEGAPPGGPEDDPAPEAEADKLKEAA